MPLHKHANDCEIIKSNKSKKLVFNPSLSQSV